MTLLSVNFEGVLRVKNMISCLWFDSEAEEAAKLYTKVFGGEVGAITRYGKSSSSEAGKPIGSTLSVAFQMANLKVLGLNGGPIFKFTPSFSLFVGCDSAEEIERY
jgi:predicted 3-demethylubiquinone-9 3-methyltransferase (glyoxalase superfamily)